MKLPVLSGSSLHGHLSSWSGYRTLTNALFALVALAATICALAVFAINDHDADNSKRLETLLLSGLDSEADPKRLIELSYDKPTSIDQFIDSENKQQWVIVPIIKSTQPDSTAFTLDFQIIRPLQPTFWIATTKNGGYELTRIESSAVRTEKSGFSVSFESRSRPQIVVGTFQSSMPSKVVAKLWHSDQYLKSKDSFHKKGGALFGSLLILTAFSAIVAITNKDLTFLLFSAWLITGLRVAAINGGWDATWLGASLRNDLYLLILRSTVAGYGFFTVAIFQTLFLKNSTDRRIKNFFEFLRLTFAALTLSAFAFAHIDFLRVFWAISGIAIGTSMVFLTYNFAKKPLSPSSLYAAAWIGMIIGMLSEIGFQTGFFYATNLFNSQLATIISALLMSIALAHKIKTDRAEKVIAQDRSVRYLKKFQDNFNSMPIGLFSINSSGSLILFNPAFYDLFNSSDSSEPRNLEGLNIDRLLGQQAGVRLVEAANAPASCDLEFSVPTTNDSYSHYLVRVSRAGDTLEGSIQDITAKKVAERQLRNLVDHDHLTGLLNRRGLENAVRKATEEVSTRVACAIAHIDIDRFKLFNDLHGFGTGDLLLQQVAQRISNVSRSRDSVARVADSFVVVLHDCSEAAAASAMERVREAITSERFDINGKALNITVSIGVVALDQSMGYADVTAAAGRACSEAKARGRNCVVRLNEHDATLRSHLEELRVVADLQQRIPTDRYFLEFQPIVALQSPQSSLSYEVLIRMRAEDGTVLPPARFIGAAERHGLMSQIDRWVLRSTLEWLDTHPEHRERLAFATINLSGASLNDKRFVDDAFALMADHPLSVAKMCFEITESVALHDMGSTRRFADRVRMHGSKLALDDFGAGYTSFNYLKEIPADFIKIDGSFVKDINRDPANFSITRTIVELTHELGMRSIAEWAETPDTIASLIDLDVDFGQGFGLVRPIAPELVTSALSGGALIQDPQVLKLLEEGPRRSITSSKVRALRSVSR